MKRFSCFWLRKPLKLQGIVRYGCSAFQTSNTTIEKGRAPLMGIYLGIDTGTSATKAIACNVEILINGISKA